MLIQNRTVSDLEYLHIIEQEWNNMAEGKRVNRENVPPIIYESWMRSMDYHVDPYKPINIIQSNADVDKLTSCEELFDEYGEIINIIRDMADELGYICRIADKELKTIKILADPEAIKKNIAAGNYFGLDNDEKVVGTNALYLAVKHNKPIQMIGAEHYKKYIHHLKCTSAPLHDVNGEIIGVINISTSFEDNLYAETMALTIALAKMLDNNLAIKKMLNDATMKNEILNKIMEFAPSGMFYINSNMAIEAYNQRLLELFKINAQDNEIIQRKIIDYMKFSGLDFTHEFINKEKFLKIGGKTESFLFSNKVVPASEGQQNGNIVALDNTNNILKLQATINGNNAIYHFDDIKGKNSKLLKTIEIAKKIANSNSPIIIQGESGTGKELMAQAIHNASSRSRKPFIAINCGAIPPELIESELFGYEAGSFTGALRTGKPGKFELAYGGTIFLDEIESMPLNVQIKCLRVLSTNMVTKVGGNNEIPIDVRILSATKKDLLNEVEKGNFREDFYYRINVFTLMLPPLRERIDDIELLTNYMINYSIRYNNDLIIDEKFSQALKAYSWRGNIRELKNVIDRALLLLGEEKKLTLDYLPEEIVENFLTKNVGEEINRSFESKKEGEYQNLLKISEEIAIKAVIKEADGNLSKAAGILGISRSTLYNKLKSYGPE